VGGGAVGHSSEGGVAVDFDAVVIGSGFGGTVAATKLSGRGKQVLLLERGTWWISPEQLGKPPAPAPGKLPMRDWLTAQNEPVQYWPRPDHSEGLLDVFASVRTEGNTDGLYKFSLFDQATIVTSSTVGGGSMIYSNVTIRPPQEVLADIGLTLGDGEYQAAYEWMQNFRGPLNRIVTKIPLPGRDVSNLTDDDYLYLDRSRVLKEAAAGVAQKLGLELPWAPLDLAVLEYDPDRQDKSAAAKNHTFCERQGRCILGCLPAARETLNKSLYAHVLSDPTSGVALSPLSEARRIRKVASGYEVDYVDHRSGDEHSVSTKLLFLAGGTLGTTELLLRSRDSDGLALSDTLGEGFSTNGDFGAFVVKTAKPVHSARGPVNTCHVAATVDGTHITIEDCSIPSMFAPIASVALNMLDNWAQRRLFHAKLRLAWLTHTLPDLRDFLPHLPNTYDPNDARTEAETVANIFFFNVMGQDDASGSFRLDDDDELDLSWDKPIVEHETFKKADTLCREFATAMGGDYVALWDALPRKKLVIPHPLGGCRIGSTVAQGVVDEYGRVFDSSGEPTDVHDDLYIVDGSTIPGALSVNPTLTITAQALKAVNHALATEAAEAAAPAPVGHNQ
jgi:cholesterol oxidase